MSSFSFFKKHFRTIAPPENADTLFFGLGNSGRRYGRTRHNAGFRVADALADELQRGTVKTGRCAEAEYTAGTLECGKRVTIIKPRTFMNRSGDAVKRFAGKGKCPLERILVIVDDYNLPIGKIRARRSGSDGGHNGLKSIIECMGDSFARLRVGIGPLPEGLPSIDFVLGTWSGGEEAAIREVLPRAVDACKLFAENGIEAVMNKFNN